MYVTSELGNAWNVGDNVNITEFPINTNPITFCGKIFLTVKCSFEAEC